MYDRSKYGIIITDVFIYLFDFKQMLQVPIATAVLSGCESGQCDSESVAPLNWGR